MQYVYILYGSQDKQLYVGCTSNLKQRFSEHNKGRITATKTRRPLKLLFYESFVNKSDAFAREQWFKSGYGRNHIKNMLSETLKSLGR